MKRFLLTVALVLVAGVAEADAQSFLERLADRAARAAEEAAIRKAEELAGQAVEKVSDPGTYKGDGEGQREQGQPAAVPDRMFVYPRVGEWAMSVVACNGDAATGEVAITVSATKLTAGVIPGGNARLTEARATGGERPFELQTLYSWPIYDFVPGRAVEIGFARVLGVPADTETLDVAFIVDNRPGFALRGCPIVWAGVPKSDDQTVVAQAIPEEPIAPIDFDAVSKDNEVDGDSVGDEVFVGQENTDWTFEPDYEVDWEYEASWKIRSTVIERYCQRRSLEERLFRRSELALQHYGLVTIKRTGKYAYIGDTGKLDPDYEYMRVEVTTLGQKYLKPKEKLDSYNRSQMERVFEPWEEFKDLQKTYKSYRLRAVHGRYYVDGEPLYIGVFDAVAIRNDVQSGELKPKYEYSEKDNN